ncbi:oxidoreductase [Corynebacterium sp. HS2168-gen11]|uniref:oxidoreductase n=1 Tax=Corynebacterium sp. HS2168-gen11 TaxID=2974027 RepID=UPI00216AF7AD|nr:oxidoreductase [Corynebacterium sp. HS2168-gen11]MCS4536156.1 oxidoreductase [Corynebacterium sp. HS2168-gen11]
MFKFFGRKGTRSNLKPARGPGETVRKPDLAYLQQWVAERARVEGYIEPETLVNEMSVCLVDAVGDFTRRPIGGPKGIDVIAKALQIPLYDVEETGYPQRMRQKIERDRMLRKREEQRRRREALEKGERFE